MELDWFPLIKFTVYTNTISSSHASGGWRGQGHLHTSITRKQRARGMKLPPTQSPETGGGTAQLPAVRAGLPGGGQLVIQPHVLPAPRRDRETKGMPWGPDCHPHPVPPLQAHGWLCFLVGSFVCPYHTICFCPAQWRVKQCAVPTPKFCYLILPNRYL